MSGGGGGPIIIRRIAEGSPVTQEDRDELHEIADRSTLCCSITDAIRVLTILWKYLRAV
jgi:hypothetical protein